MNSLFGKAREKFLRGQIAWQTDTIKGVLVDAADYTVNLASHEFLSDIPVAGRVATSDSLTGKTTTNGWASAADISFPAAAGDVCEAIVLIKDTGDPATSPLIAYIGEATNLPVTLNGSTVTVILDSLSDGIFQL